MKKQLKKIGDRINPILKTAIVFDSILNLEKKIGILLPLNDLIEQIKDDSKRYNEKLSTKEIKEILHVMLLSGIIFYPQKNFIERFTAHRQRRCKSLFRLRQHKKNAQSSDKI